ncbi:glyoxalase/bleomycin resistance protein/dioxygenase superfamily protein [Arthrobacter sp. SLBN-100]|uniref:VOC family protein n=1 Tax=Arthrobacter sp. SLBN-100 TaxID=2768450 RepID=UPI00115011A2|nr:VOC family protein [Arthrobacter sp. SLBN-100]TQJ62068.1 glyoxalase/bleomycin resistance protein/dioxygenase superfamily protein [Arthrobacter sp. SLBN-100]TQJ62093.1 glyoxalase/bleomycin resistance protein/dioxygenase superfamily protein [Arthrobacter sp. SLBN-100]
MPSATTPEKSIYANVRKPRPIKVPMLHHATFMTLDVDAMVHWYEQVCGLQPVYYAEHAAWMTNDEANHRIALLRLPGTKVPVDKPHTVGLHHTAFEYASSDQWLDNYERLRDAGILPEICLHHGMTMSMYYVDPDGNGVEIQVDVFGAWDKSTEWMWASREFAADQIGAQFDPEKLLAARRDGLDFDSIQRGAYAGNYLPANPGSPTNFPDVWPARLAEHPEWAEHLPEGAGTLMPANR